ncbi:hypothetical protein NC651_000084 [Populus alba x Populus x berolinensis]|nr:hypothetical protein NC651_000084 [Populus alba x Populus x berolinensis]
MRPNNILITHDHEALLGDLGLARTQYEDSEQSWGQELLELLDAWHQNMQKVGKCHPRPMFILSGGAIAADHRTTDYRQETSRKKSCRMGFGELIPAKSDSPSSAGYSYESQDYYDTSSTSETLSTSFTADSMSTSSMGDMSL